MRFHRHAKYVIAHVTAESKTTSVVCKLIMSILSACSIAGKARQTGLVTAADVLVKHRRQLLDEALHGHAPHVCPLATASGLRRGPCRANVDMQDVLRPEESL